MLLEYTRATLRHIYLLLVGAIGAILSIVGIVVPSFVQAAGLILLAFGLFGAQFMAWRDMRDERNKVLADASELERRSSEGEAGLRAELDLRGKRKALRDSLGEYFSQGEEVREWIERGGEPLGDVTSGSGFVYFGRKPRDREDESLRGSLERASEWEEEVKAFLYREVGHSYAATFRSQIGTNEQQPPSLGSEKHSEAWAMVDRRLQKLATIIREVGDELIGA